MKIQTGTSKPKVVTPKTTPVKRLDMEPIVTEPETPAVSPPELVNPVDEMLRDIEEAEVRNQESANLLAEFTEYRDFARASRNLHEAVTEVLRICTQLDSVTRGAIGNCNPVLRWSAPDAMGNVVELEFASSNSSTVFQQMLLETAKVFFDALKDCEKRIEELRLTSASYLKQLPITRYPVLDPKEAVEDE